MTNLTDPTADPPAVIDVLLVEDDPGDVLMTREAFEEHKLRNALHVLHLRGTDPPTVAWARDVADRQVEHLTRLVDDLLDVSRIQQGKVELRPERLDQGNSSAAPVLSRSRSA